MNDLISRQAAINEIKAVYEWHDTVTEDRLIEHMKQLPSAQPERTEYIPETKAVRSKRDCVDLSERVSATFYDQEHEEWTQQTVTIADVLDSVCDEYTILPSAQPEPKWIPCSERLPEENIPILLGVRFKDDFKYFVTTRMDYNYWAGLGRDIRGKLAWMPLPEPYRGDKHETD